MQYGLIGEHLPHSFSKEIHAKCASYPYELVELTREEVGAFMERAAFSAINVTIPYKETVMPYLADIDEAARAIGSVNTVVKRDGRLYGYNTDFYGLTSLLRHLSLSLRGKKVLILGTGGTAKTARAVAMAEGAATILTVSRKASEHTITYREAEALHRDAAVIINTTPCGMYPYPDGNEQRAAQPISLDAFPRLLGVIDAVYNPLRTSLILSARARGIPAEGGLYMLVAQGYLASRIFLSEDPDEVIAAPDTAKKIEEVYRDVLREKENIVLIGMPSSGKSTVGKLLAEALGRRFIDSDAVITARAGKEIPTIFKEEGEGGFRAREAAVIAELANGERGAVIATGGGAILRDDNIRALQRTGRLYFLDRPLADLAPTADRPLSTNHERLAALYKERLPRYLAVCDVRVAGTASAEEAAATIIKEWKK